MAVASLETKRFSPTLHLAVQPPYKRAAPH
jgi:hypothetical protein